MKCVYMTSTYVCFPLQNVAVEVVEDESEEQVEDHKVANNQGWYEDSHTDARIFLIVNQLRKVKHIETFRPSL